MRATAVVALDLGLRAFPIVMLEIATVEARLHCELLTVASWHTCLRLGRGFPPPFPPPYLAER